MKNLVTLCLLLLASGFTHTVTAQQEWDRSGFYLNGGIGYQFFDSDRDLDDDWTALVGGEYRYGPNWAAEVRYYYTDTSNVDVDQLGVDGLYYFMPQRTFDPYLAAGLGGAKFDGGPLDDKEAQVNFGGGVRFYATDHFSLRADARAIYGSDDDTIDAVTSLMVSWRFGPDSRERKIVRDEDGDGVIDDQDRCPGTPAGVNVDSVGCPADSDGDGVPDYLDKCPDTPKGATVDENGCPTNLKVSVTMSAQINFKHNSSQIEPSSQPELQKIADFLKKYGSVAADIEGHTDSSGSSEYNQKLSQKRANAVVESLVSGYGINAERLTAVGSGEDKPIASNDTEEGRNMNRRVEVVLKGETQE